MCSKVECAHPNHPLRISKRANPSKQKPFKKEASREIGNQNYNTEASFTAASSGASPYNRFAHSAAQFGGLEA